MKRTALLVAALASVAVTACGGGGRDRPDADARLLLDAAPNAVHAGIYLAAARGFTDAEGVDLEIQVPAEGTDPLELLRANRADLAVLDLHALARAREQGRDLVAVMALVQRPLRAVYATPRVRSPRALAGAEVALPGDPADAALLDAVVAGDGGDPSAVRRTDAGSGATRALRSGRADATVGALHVDGPALEAALPGVREFRPDRFGAPAHPGLVLVARRATIQDAPALVQATVTALRRGYREVILGPEEAVGVLTDRVDGLDRAVAQDQLDAVLPAFAAAGNAFGVLEPRGLERWAVWAQRVGLTRRRADVSLTFAPRFARRGVISG